MLLLHWQIQVQEAAVHSCVVQVYQVIACGSTHPWVAGSGLVGHGAKVAVDRGALVQVAEALCQTGAVQVGMCVVMERVGGESGGGGGLLY